MFYLLYAEVSDTTQVEREPEPKEFEKNLYQELNSCS